MHGAHPGGVLGRDRIVVVRLLAHVELLAWSAFRPFMEDAGTDRFVAVRVPVPDGVPGTGQARAAQTVCHDHDAVDRTAAGQHEREDGLCFRGSESCRARGARAEHLTLIGEGQICQHGLPRVRVG